MRSSTWWQVWTYAPLALTPFVLLTYLLAMDGVGIQGAAIGASPAVPSSINAWTVIMLIGSVYVLWLVSMVAASISRRRMR